MKIDDASISMISESPCIFVLIPNHLTRLGPPRYYKNTVERSETLNEKYAETGSFNVYYVNIGPSPATLMVPLYFSHAESGYIYEKSTRGIRNPGGR